MWYHDIVCLEYLLMCVVSAWGFGLFFFWYTRTNFKASSMYIYVMLMFLGSGIVGSANLYGRIMHLTDPMLFKEWSKDWIWSTRLILLLVIQISIAVHMTIKVLNNNWRRKELKVTLALRKMEEDFEATQAVSDKQYLERLRLLANKLNEMTLARRNAISTLHELIDAYPAEICVIDVHTFEIIYMNRKLVKSYGAPVLGQPCYKVLKGRTSPCDDCRDIDPDNPESWVRACKHLVSGVNQYLLVTVLHWYDGRLVKFLATIDESELRDNGEAGVHGRTDCG